MTKLLYKRGPTTHWVWQVLPEILAWQQYHFLRLRTMIIIFLECFLIMLTCGRFLNLDGIIYWAAIWVREDTEKDCENETHMSFILASNGGQWWHSKLFVRLIYNDNLFELHFIDPVPTHILGSFEDLKQMRNSTRHFYVLSSPHGT